MRVLQFEGLYVYWAKEQQFCDVVPNYSFFPCFSPLCQANSFFVFYSPIKYYWIYNFDWAGKIIVFVIVLCCHVRLSFGKFAPIKKNFFLTVKNCTQQLELAV